MSDILKKIKYTALHEISRWRVNVGRPFTHVCICGYPRSGTTLLYNTMASTLRGFAWEDYEEASIKSLRLYGNRISKCPKDVFNVCQFFDNNKYQKRIVVIVMVRDLRDIITSTHAQLPDDYFISYNYGLNVRGTWPNYVSEPSAVGIKDTAEAIEECKSATGVELVQLRYEDLVADPDSIQDRLVGEHGLRFKRRFSTLSGKDRTKGVDYSKGRHKAADCSLIKVDQDITRAYVGRWAKPELIGRVIEQFDAHPEMFRLLQMYGYEQDNSWFDEIASAGMRAGQGDGVEDSGCME